MSNTFVVCMGIGTVFVGLILIIIMCKIVGLFCKIFVKENKPVPTPVAADNGKAIENRQEIIAAVTAACAEDMGTDVSALRVVSFKKI
ncbi:MAG: OadG family protein [Clostridia bacterium]|nr:OadG family protein [Clostridia bacterium]